MSHMTGKSHIFEKAHSWLPDKSVRPCLTLRKSVNVETNLGSILNLLEKKTCQLIAIGLHFQEFLIDKII